jgi:DNA-binding IclR family transcriptional regulator
LAVLDILADEPGPWGVAELTRRLALHKSTVHRLLMVLARHDFVRREPGHGKYRLGMRLFELGSRAVAEMDLRRRAEPFLRRLVDETGETAHVAILRGAEMVSIANVESPLMVRTPTTVGRRTPLHCTSVGKSVLAFLFEREREALLTNLPLERFTPKTLVTRAALNAELIRVRQRGYATDDEEIETGMRCVGAPVHDGTGGVVGAISIAGPVFRVTKDRVPVFGAAVLEASRRLSVELGYRAPKAPAPDGRTGGRTGVASGISRRQLSRRMS